MTARGCTGKWSFESFARAAASAKAINRRGKDAHLRAYKCRVCGKFHVGENDDYGKRDARREVQLTEE